MSSFTLGPTATQSTTIPTAAALTTTVQTPTLTTVSTNIGQATGFGEIFGLGGGSFLWPSLDNIGDPDGNGWCWDSTFLAGQYIEPQQWSGVLYLNTTNGSIIADLYVRWSVYNSDSGAYVTQGTILLPQQTITTSATPYTFTQYLNQITGDTNNFLYLDCWANITQNSSGTNAANLVVSQVASNLTIVNGATNNWVVQYQPMTPTQLATRYSYGTFCFHDGVNYLLTKKSISAVPVKETLFKIARFEGMKKTGEVTNARTITLEIRVLGSSRADLESKLDALYQAFSQRQQNLTLHSVDGRYYLADCVGMDATLAPGSILSAIVSATFLCQQPYAYAAQQLFFTSGGVSGGNIGGQNWQLANQTIMGGGNVFNRPTIILANNLQRNTVTLTGALTSGNPYTSLSVSSIGTTIPSGTWLYLNDNAGHTQHIQTSAQANSGATSISVTSFNANANYPASSSSVYQDHYITGFTLTQNPDGTTLSVSNLGFTWGGQQVITLICDPSVAGGYTVVCNSQPNTLLAFTGTFPVFEPGANTIGLVATSYNRADITIQAQWTPRWLA